MRPVTRFVPRQRAQRRLGIVYGINTLDPASGTVEVGYVGQTVQALWQRERQHRETQPWSDLIVGQAYVIERGLWTCAELDAREAFHIKRLQPRYPYEHNLSNPRRIPVYVARRQRLERDRARGVVLTAWQVPSRSLLGSWSPRRRKAAVLVGVWLLLAVAGWAGAVIYVHVSLSAGAELGAGAALGVYFAAWRGRKPRRRRPTRRSRRRRR